MIPQNLTDMIEGLLIAYPSLRDDDNTLVTKVWKKEMDIKQLPDFLTAYAYKQITMSDTITRIRRKLQEEKPELRGSKWHERHDKEQQVITDLKSIV